MKALSVRKSSQNGFQLNMAENDYLKALHNPFEMR